MHCPCGFQTNLDPRTADYHRAHRDQHLAKFPQSDAETRASLDQLVNVFEKREAKLLDASAALKQVETILDTTSNACGRDRLLMVAALIGALGTMAVNSDDGEKLLQIAIDNLTFAKHQIAKMKAGGLTGQVPS